MRNGLGGPWQRGGYRWRICTLPRRNIPPSQWRFRIGGSKYHVVFTTIRIWHIPVLLFASSHCRGDLEAGV